MARKRVLEPIHPGEILFEEFMKPMGISINRLARDIQVSPGRISSIVNGKRAISADTALRLGKYLRTSSDLWIGLQGEFDLRVTKRTIGPEIERCIQAYVA
ncbi:Virulence-associated protein I [Candidatus Nitrospira nitrosa]|uniref:Virulence-associated protein I n=1 Tax=Candidatus Nitrospira nitrosa TaxID=1742972 RepID=A0A0S4LQC9_9BACT|nr:HigA family addiction module antitoxin [Candidatus Nitrospira nitrosa]CUS39731.1 Virulence-associated protein I [Candidatus Nitrospira nitrosa]